MERTNSPLNSDKSLPSPASKPIFVLIPFAIWLRHLSYARSVFWTDMAHYKLPLLSLSATTSKKTNLGTIATPSKTQQLFHSYVTHNITTQKTPTLLKFSCEKLTVEAIPQHLHWSVTQNSKTPTNQQNTTKSSMKNG